MNLDFVSDLGDLCNFISSEEGDLKTLCGSCRTRSVECVIDSHLEGSTSYLDVFLQRMSHYSSIGWATFADAVIIDSNVAIEHI